MRVFEQSSPYENKFRNELKNILSEYGIPARPMSVVSRISSKTKRRFATDDLYSMCSKPSRFAYESFSMEEIRNIINECVREVLNEDEMSRRDKLFAKAKEHFGTTNNFRVVGYILPDGSMLDFSGRCEGGPTDRRVIDHRDVRSHFYDYAQEDPDYETSMMDFIRNGAIRICPESAAISLIVKPTDAQMSQLRRYIDRKYGEVIVEITDENDDTAFYKEYDMWTDTDRILRTIKNRTVHYNPTPDHD